MRRRRRIGYAKRRATPQESRRNFATAVEYHLVRDHGFTKGEATVALQNHGAFIDAMHDNGDFPSSAALRIDQFETEESAIPRRRQ